MYVQSVLAALFGTNVYFGSGKQPFPWIHIDDLVGMYISILESGFQGPLNAVAPELVTMKHFSHQLGRSVSPFFKMSIPVAIPSFVCKKILGNIPSHLVLQGQIVKSSRIQQLPFSFKFPSLDSALSNLASQTSYKSAISQMFQ